jgi:phosphatidylserine synthase
MTTLQVRSMWTNVTTAGVAMSETALCDDCQHSGSNALDFTLLAMRQDDFGGRTARQRVENDALSCQACGLSSRPEDD